MNINTSVCLTDEACRLCFCVLMKWHASVSPDSPQIIWIFHLTRFYYFHRLCFIPECRFVFACFRVSSELLLSVSLWPMADRYMTDNHLCNKSPVMPTLKSYFNINMNMEMFCNILTLHVIISNIIYHRWFSFSNTVIVLQYHNIYIIKKYCKMSHIFKYFFILGYISKMSKNLAQPAMYQYILLLLLL